MGWALALFGSAGLCAVPLLFRHEVRHWQPGGRLTRKVVLVGAGEHGRRLAEYLRRVADPSVRIVGVFDDRKDRAPARVAGHRVRGGLDGGGRHGPALSQIAGDVVAQRRLHGALRNTPRWAQIDAHRLSRLAWGQRRGGAELLRRAGPGAHAADKARRPRRGEWDARGQRCLMRGDRARERVGARRSWVES